MLSSIIRYYYKRSEPNLTFLIVYIENFRSNLCMRFESALNNASNCLQKGIKYATKCAVTLYYHMVNNNNKG